MDGNLFFLQLYSQAGVIYFDRDHNSTLILEPHSSYVCSVPEKNPPRFFIAEKYEKMIDQRCFGYWLVFFLTWDSGKVTKCSLRFTAKALGMAMLKNLFFVF